MRQEAGAEPCLFGWHLIDPSQRVVAIVEGEIDAMSLHQVGIPALSVNAGAGNHQWIDSDWSRLERFSEIYLCYDNDEAGQKGAKEVANRLGLDRCKLVVFEQSKDANEFLQNGATAEEFRICLSSARTFDPDELRSISDFWPGVKALFYPSHDVDENPSLSFCGQKQFWFEFRPGEVTVWTGYNGHGKSLLLNQVLLGLMLAGERACVFSGEMTPQRQGKRIAKQIGGLDRPAPAYLDFIGEWLRDRMWLFALVGTASIDRLLTVFAYAYKRYGIRHCVIDSLMMTDVQADGPGSITSQKDVMRKLANWARANDTHVHLVAHPRKGVDEKRAPGKQDVSGAGVITDAADNVFSVWSAQKEEADAADDEPDAFLELHKQRNGDTQHRKLALFFNRESQQFSTSSARRPFVHLPFSQTTQEQFA
jgi:twinkle protein